tara:strand:+ start:18832 stop:19485 length:654 start_codon:yes stop_codon:yes gene_type:complete
MISILGFINVLLYGLIQYFITTNSINFLTPLDSYMPLMPELIWVYHSLPIVMVVTIMFLTQNKQLLYTVISSFLAVMVVNSLFHIIAPSFYPRPELIPQTLSEEFLMWTYNIDGANNTFPSTHVSYAFLMMLTAADTQKAKLYPILKYCFILWAVMITISTLLLKQHYIADVVSALILTGLIYKAMSNYYIKRKQNFEARRISLPAENFQTNQVCTG